MKLHRQTHQIGDGYTFRISLPGHKFSCLETFDSPEDAALAADIFKTVLVRRYRLSGNTMWPSLSPEVFSRLIGEIGIDRTNTEDFYIALSASCKDYLLDGGHETLTAFMKAQDAIKAGGGIK